MPMGLCLHAAQPLRATFTSRPPAHRRSRTAAARDMVARLAVAAPAPPGLSPREAELLPWLATDLGYAAIARELGCSLSNIRHIVRRLCRRLGVVTRPAAVARWLRPEGFAAGPATWPKGHIDGRANNAAGTS
jgi:DNA-binding CsgD family transcriptional regulator